MKKLLFLCLSVGMFLNIQSYVLFKENGKESYEGLIEQANKNDVKALTFLNEAWTKEAAKFRFIDDYLTKKGYSKDQVTAKLAAHNKPVVAPTRPPVAPVAPGIPTTAPGAPSAPGIPMAPVAPSAPPMAPAVSPGAIASLTDAQRNSLIQKIEALLSVAVEGSTAESNLKNYLKKLKSKTLKNREMTSLEEFLSQIDAEKEKEAELKKQEAALQEQFNRDAGQVEANLKQEVRNRIVSQNLKTKLDSEFAGNSNGKVVKDAAALIVKDAAALIMFFDEAQKAINSIKKRLNNIDQEPEVINIAQDLEAQSNTLASNIAEIKKLQASLTQLDEAAILSAVATIKKLTAANSILAGNIEALKNQKEPIVKIIRANLENKIKILEQIIENKTEELRTLSISKEDGSKLLGILGIKQDPNSPLTRIIAAKKSSVKPSGVGPTPEELARMHMAGGGGIGSINRPSTPVSAASAKVSPVEAKLAVLLKSIAAFELKPYVTKDIKDTKTAGAARKYYTEIKDNDNKLTDEQRISLIDALEKDLHALSQGDALYIRRVQKAKSDKSASIFTEYENEKSFL